MIFMLELFASASERTRRRVIPKLGRVVQRLNRQHGTDLYVENPTWAREFVGRVEMAESEFESFLLQECGFKPNPLAARKHRTNDGQKEYEEGSFRWVPDSNSGLDNRFQLHVRTFDGDVAPNADTGYTLVYAHWEYRWDTNPIKHYRGVEWNPEKGVSMMRELLDANYVTYTTDL